MFSHIQIQHMNFGKSAENYILFAYSHYSLDIFLIPLFQFYIKIITYCLIIINLVLITKLNNY